MKKRANLNMEPLICLARPKIRLSHIRLPSADRPPTASSRYTTFSRTPPVSLSWQPMTAWRKPKSDRFYHFSIAERPVEVPSLYLGDCQSSWVIISRKNGRNRLYTKNIISEYMRRQLPCRLLRSIKPASKMRCHMRTSRSCWTSGLPGVAPVGRAAGVGGSVQCHESSRPGSQEKR